MTALARVYSFSVPDGSATTAPTPSRELGRHLTMRWMVLADADGTTRLALRWVGARDLHDAIAPVIEIRTR